MWVVNAKAHGYYGKHILPSAFLMLFQASWMSDLDPLQSHCWSFHKWVTQTTAEQNATLDFVYVGQS